jgi:hypothetical protein
MEKDKSIKSIADEMFGIAFREKVKDALGEISDEELNCLKKSAKGRKIIKKIEQIR